MAFNSVTELKPFQKETVNWMINQEKTKDGGLLLNEPGTGKSLCCIDLIVKTHREKGITLVICPAGLVLNWIEEIKLHSNICEEFIGVYIGKKRKNLLLKGSFKNKMIIVTSYNIVSRDNDLSNIKFKRIILDEGHYIRNSNGSFFKSILELKAEKKWVVTATPIFNDINDMYSYVRFLELEGIDSRSEWKNRMNGKQDILANFRFINRLIGENSIGLKKCDVLKELPEKNETVIGLETDGFERDFYDTLWEYSLKRIANMSLRIQRLTGLKDVNSKIIRQCLSNNVLVYILRLKQCCNNPWLVIKTMSRLKNVKSIKQAAECLAYYNLSKTTEEECPICYDQQANIIVSPCGHKYCESCCDKLLKHNINKCPKCRIVISSTKKIKEIEIIEQDSNNIENMDIKRSVKIEKMISIIREKLDKHEKIVVVSQWVSMLELAKSAVEQEFEKVKCVVLTGGIPIVKRVELIKDFQTDSEIKICFVSLMSSAEGINLTAANNLIMLDTWWNNSKMSQVYDRIHRIGQTKVVNIYKLMITNSNSIETKIVELVNKKGKISNMIINKWSIFDTENYDSSWISSAIKLIERTKLENE